MVAVLHCEVRPNVPCKRNLISSSDTPLSVDVKVTLTGRNRSRSHQIAWLVCAGEEANIRIGSQRTKHSQIDQRLGRQASKSSSGGGWKGADVARILSRLRRALSGMRSNSRELEGHTSR